MATVTSQRSGSTFFRVALSATRTSSSINVTESLSLSLSLWQDLFCGQAGGARLDLGRIVFVSSAPYVLGPLSPVNAADDSD